MYKLMLIVLMAGLWMTAQALQIDEEMAMQLLDQSKRAVNRAAHAGAQQLDREALAEGRLRIDPAAASDYAMAYLRGNLQLDEAGAPLPNSPLKEPVRVLALDVINDDHSFPYVYRNETYDFEAVLDKPGVVFIVRVAYPRIFAALDPIEWDIKGVSELVFMEER
ncbi:hypothetical protein ACFSL6_09035 [Paenibacillus thailandensis]|uniref:Peptidase M23 n=1 Tax=Paenibacillus thailandensis TaxID=393250 RepID=A0ABW5QZN9_9BACL